MKKLTIFTILLTIWVGVFSQGSINQVNNGNSANNKSYHPLGIEELIDVWSLQHVPGLSTCVLKDGELYWVYHSGWANLEQDKPVNDSSIFWIASISKTFVQTAAMQLWEQNDFELDDYVGDSLDFPVVNPEYPGSAITFYQLMTHTSSIRDNPETMYQPWTGGVGGHMEEYFSPEGSNYDPANFYTYAPGTQWNYSNMGNWLLGYLVEVIADQDYGNYCQEHIIEPLGIINGSIYEANLNPENLVTHYSYNGGYVPATTPDGGPASMKISAIELAKFLGMYMQEGTYNDSTILQPETIELILTPTSFIGFDNSLQCLTWLYSEYYDIFYHTGSSDKTFAIMAFDKDDQWGVITLMNCRPSITNLADLIINMEYFASIYNPFAIASIEVNDTDEDQVIEANETFDLGLILRNDMNYPDVAENIIATMSVNSPYVNLISDSVVSLGTLNYLDEIQLPSDQFVFEVNENLEPGNVEFQIHFTWDNGGEYTTSFELFAGHADVLLVRDEDSVSVSFTGGLKTIQDRYLESLDTLGFLTNYWDLEVMGDPTSEFIQNFPAVIWFTGADGENTLSENNQTLLTGYLDNGGQLFLSGQDISDALAGSNFLENYLFTEHIQDTWYGAETIKGIEEDLIGNGQTYSLNQGDGIANQTSMSIIEPLEGAYKSFGYFPPLDGAAVRYENDTYRTIFFAFGFEAIDGFNNRTDILDRILNDYFIMPHPCLPEGITFTTQEEIDNFQSNYPGCIEIEGDVTINGDDITNLDGLDVITAIGGMLVIGDTLYPYNGNPMLTNLEGLESLTSIEGSLHISGNSSLVNTTGLNQMASIGVSFKIQSNDSMTSFIGLENLTSIGGTLWIVANDNLTSLTGLDNLTSIAGGTNHILNNDALINLSGMESLTFIEGSLVIYGNEGLVNLTGLENLTSIGGNLTLGWGCGQAGGGQSIPNLVSLEGLDNLTSIGGGLTIQVCPVLTSLNGLSNLTSIGGGLYVGCNSDLNSLIGLDNLTSIGGSLVFESNPSLTSLNGLENLTFIPGSLAIGEYIGGNASLINLTGLNNVTSIGGSLFVNKNHSLNNLSGLENLTSLGGDIIIGGEWWDDGNPTLMSLSALDNIDAATIENIVIQHNDTLSDCDAQSICDYLTSPNGTVEIHDNALGCNDTIQVQAACNGVSIKEQNLEEIFTISPNPNSGFINLQFTIYEQGFTIIDLFDVSGVKVKSIINEIRTPGTYEMEIDLNDIPVGIYFCTLKTNKGIQTKKIIKLN